MYFILKIEVSKKMHARTWKLEDMEAGSTFCQ